MKKLLIAAAAGVLALVAGCATAKEEAAAPAPVSAVVAPQPALWVVRDADSTIYLYGTIHLRKAGASWGGPAAERALAEAQEVWTEIDMDPAKEGQMQGLVMKYGIDTVRPLSSKVTPARWAQIQSAAASFGLPAANLEPMKPWLASLTFTVLPMTKAGYDPNAGVDRSIDRLARAGGKTMRAFETAEQQLQFFSTFTEEMQVQMLYESLDEMDKGAAALTTMETAWEKGDDRMLATEMVAEMARDYPALYDVLLKRRNAAWTDTLANELKGSGVDFVAVGAAHLAGPDSVQALLTARRLPGVSVERVTPAPY